MSAGGFGCDEMRGRIAALVTSAARLFVILSVGPGLSATRGGGPAGAGMF